MINEALEDEFDNLLPLPPPKNLKVIKKNYKDNKVRISWDYGDSSEVDKFVLSINPAINNQNKFTINDPNVRYYDLKNLQKGIRYNYTLKAKTKDIKKV